MRQSAVIGFVAENENRVLLSNSQSLNFRFEQRGYAGAIIDLLQPDWLDQFTRFTDVYDVRFCYGYAGIGAHIKRGQKSLWDEWRIPFLSLLYDHPFYYPAHHEVATKYVCNCYAVQDFLQVQRNYIGSSQPCVLLRISSNGYSSALDPRWRNRDIDALYLKTGHSLAPFEASFEVMPAAYRTLTWDCIRAAQKNANLLLADLVRDSFKAYGIDPKQDPRIWDDFIYIVRVIDQYLRDWRSNQLVEELKHLAIVVIGAGWNHIDKTNTKAIFLPSISAVEVGEYLYRAKFILNTHPYGQYTWHERVFQGLERGARVISDRTQFTDQYFVDLPNFMGFDWGDPNWSRKVESYIQEKRDQPPDVAPAQALLVEQFPPDAVASQMINIAEKMHNGKFEFTT